MIVLSVRDVVRQFDTAPILNRVSFEVRPGDRIGLVGPNGAGKTTLMRILAGLDDADSGAVELHPSADLSLLEQRPDFDPSRTLIEEARAGLSHIYDLQAESARLAEQIAAADAAEQARLHKRFDGVQQELHRLKGFEVEHLVERVLHGLGFRPDQYDQPIASLSGGQQNRVLLARLLLRNPTLMLLDEPTNHLDIAATEWLEQFLIDSGAAIILVSHDRYFLDRVTNRIFELHQGRIAEYPGNFSHYWRLRDERNEVARRTYDKQQELIAKTEDYIRRNKSGQNSAQAKDREQKLARIEVVEAVSDISGPRMNFGPVSRTGDWVIDTEDVSKGFDGPLFEHVNLRILRGERVGIFGPNGAGKTTFLRTILGELKPDAGRVRLGTGVQIGYFDQQLQSVDSDVDAIDAIRPADVARYTDGQLRDQLARFGVVGELALQKVGAMSGGERTKVALAKIATAGVNVLVLDEPTNHLDLWARDSLEEALKQFAGTIVFVSHDRYFLDRLATHVVVLEPHRWRYFEGNYSDFLHFEAARAAELALQEAKKKSSPAAATAAPSGKEAKRRRQFPYRKVEDLEREIAELEATVARCQNDLGDEAVHRDAAKLKSVTALFEKSQTDLARLYEHWEEAVELN